MRQTTQDGGTTDAQLTELQEQGGVMEPRPGLKPLFWIGSSRKDLRGFPAEVQDGVGYAKWRASHEEEG
jgi:hypothetical protein